MNAPLRLDRIELFPIKSLDGVLVTEALISEGGILDHDRAYAIFDADGQVVNGKRTERVHDLRCAFDRTLTEVRLWHNGEPSARQFDLVDRAPLDRWLSDFFGFSVTVRHEPNRGFPDDGEAYGPTITSAASLQTVRGWYPGLTLENVRRRFRTNLELAGGPPFCEDALFGAPQERRPFWLGDVAFLGHNPCQRCVVPSRDPDDGRGIAGFQKSFARFRQETLPGWANRARFNHFYRFAVNTSIPASEAGKRLRVGDALTVDRRPEGRAAARALVSNKARGLRRPLAAGD